MERSYSGDQANKALVVCFLCTDAVRYLIPDVNPLLPFFRFLGRTDRSLCQRTSICPASHEDDHGSGTSPIRYQVTTSPFPLLFPRSTWPKLCVRGEDRLFAWSDDRTHPLLSLFCLLGPLGQDFASDDACLPCQPSRRLFICLFCLPHAQCQDFESEDFCPIAKQLPRRTYLVTDWSISYLMMGHITSSPPCDASARIVRVYFGNIL